MQLSKCFSHICICGVFLNLIEILTVTPAFGQETSQAPDPYILSEDLSHQDLSREECIQSLTQESHQIQDSSEEINTQITSLEEQQDDLYLQFQELNQEILELEQGEGESILKAENGMKQAINDLIVYYTENNADFITLSEEEQMKIVLEDVSLQEWQEYVESIQLIIDDKVQERDQVEQEIEAITYDLEMIKDTSQESVDTLDPVYEQCLILPYSTHRLDPESVYFEGSDFQDILIEVDSFLNQLVPKAYSNLKYAHILDTFIAQMNQDKAVISQKNPVIFNDQTLDKYSFAKELSIEDISAFAKHALHSYYETQSIPEYIQDFHDIIGTKHQQFTYFYSLNSDAFRLLKSLLQDSLNMNQWISEEHIQHIQQIQDKYQVKLVIFDSESRQWQATKENLNGFEEIYDQYDFESILTDIRQNKDDSNLTEPSKISNQHKHTDLKNKKDSLDNKPHNLADKMMTHMHESRVKNLEPPKKHRISDKKKKQSAKSKPSKNKAKDKNIKLPTTGETMYITYIAITLLVIGSILMTYSHIRNRQERKEIQQQQKEQDTYSNHL